MRFLLFWLRKYFIRFSLIFYAWGLVEFVNFERMGNGRRGGQVTTETLKQREIRVKRQYTFQH